MTLTMGIPLQILKDPTFPPSLKSFSSLADVSSLKAALLLLIFLPHVLFVLLARTHAQPLSAEEEHKQTRAVGENLKN